MTTHQDIVEEVHRILSSADPTGELVPCKLRTLRIGAGQLRHVVDEVTLVTDVAAPTVVILADTTPIQVDGILAKPFVEAQLAQRFAVRTAILDDGHPELHVTDAVVDVAAAAASDADVVVSIGGGTITDIAKITCQRVGGVSHVAVQTAASVDGYTDNVSVVLRHGVKRTVPSRWPDVVIADTTLISQAPAAMNRAGFGEINSMFTAPADWYLARLVGFDNSFHHGPIALLAEVGRGIADWSRGLATSDPHATEQLVRALDLRGIATGVAGTTACLSGVEHLISHMLDVHHAAHGEPTGLHGAQVGVGSVVAAAAWQYLFEHLDAGAASIQIAGPELSPAELEEAVRAQFGPLDDTGALAAECWRDYRTKVHRWQTNRVHVDALLARWPQESSALKELVLPAADIAAGLRAAGSPATFAELEPAVPSELARWSVQHCALMRNRFTVVDLLTFLGWWTDDDVTEVMRRADAAGGGSGGTSADR